MITQLKQSIPEGNNDDKTENKRYGLRNPKEMATVRNR